MVIWHVGRRGELGIGKVVVLNPGPDRDGEQPQRAEENELGPVRCKEARVLLTERVHRRDEEEEQQHHEAHGEHLVDERKDPRVEEYHGREDGV